MAFNELRLFYLNYQDPPERVADVELVSRVVEFKISHRIAVGVFFELTVLGQDPPKIVDPRYPLVNRIPPKSYLVPLAEGEEIYLGFAVGNDFDDFARMALEVVQHFVFLDVINYEFPPLGDYGDDRHVF